MSNEVIVIGGGIVGVASALNLQEKGFDVTIIERKKIARETSYGNAGVISRGAIIPLNNPNLLLSMPEYLSNKHPAVRYKLTYAMKNAHHIFKFFMNSKKGKVLETIHTLDTLISGSLEQHQKWLSASGSLEKLRTNGFLKLYRTHKSFERSAFERSVYNDFNISHTLLDPSQIHEIEPNLNKIFNKGVLIKDAASVDNPGEVVENYARLFQERGGRIFKADVTNLFKDKEEFKINTSRGELKSYRVLIAAGPWANELLANFCFKLPMFYERGYHYHVQSNETNCIARPILDVDGCYVMTPTNLGIRINSGSEINYHDSESCSEQIQQALYSAKMALEIGERLEPKAWRGSRPTLPDSIPAIGLVPGVSNLWLACGHQHIGFNTGPTTGRLISEMMSGEETFINPTPFSPARFIKR